MERKVVLDTILPFHLSFCFDSVFSTIVLCCALRLIRRAIDKIRYEKHLVYYTSLLSFIYNLQHYKYIYIYIYLR